MSQKQLITTEEVMHALGGTQAVADLTGRGYKAAFNWLSFQAFPSNTYVVMKAAIEARGLSAPDSLWAMTAEPASPTATSEPERAA